MTVVARRGIGTRETTIGFRAPDAAAQSGTTYRQLDYWDRTGLLKPGLTPASGSGSQRLYSFADVRALTVIRRLLDSGCSLNQVRAMLAEFRSIRPAGDIWIPLEWTVQVAPGIRITIVTEDEAESA